MPGPAPLTRDEFANGFWTRVVARGECWEWQGSRNPRTGYGMVHARGISGQPLLTHRVAFELYHGRAPVGDVLHHCDNPPCCRPDHLFEGDAKANAADSIAKGRWKIGGDYRRFLNA